MNGDGARLSRELCATGCEVDAILLGEEERLINGVRLCFTLSLLFLGAGVGDAGLEWRWILRFVPWQGAPSTDLSKTLVLGGCSNVTPLTLSYSALAQRTAASLLTGTWGESSSSRG